MSIFKPEISLVDPIYVYFIKIVQTGLRWYQKIQKNQSQKFNSEIKSS